MQVLLDDIEIFALLEKADVAAFDPLKPLVLEFVYEDNWFLLLFNPAGELKGCRLFQIEEKNLSDEAEKLLIPELLSLDDNHGYDILKTRALAILEHLLRDKKSSQLYFDGH